MAYPIAAGTRNIGSDLMRYIPVLYTGKMLVKYYDSSVLTQITNTDYEGEIKKHGDTVYIRATPDMTIRDYRKGQTLVNDQPESTAVSLLIDKGKYWSFVSEDLDKVQTDLKGYINDWVKDGSEQMRITVDTTVLQDIYSDASAYNIGNSAGYRSGNIPLGTTGTPVSLSKSNILDYILGAGVALDELNVPDMGRYMILPPRIAGLIKASDLKDSSLTGDSKSILRTSVLGTIDRFTIFNSNLLATYSADSATYCLFGHKDATTFATQLVSSKVQDNPDGFGMLHRGLQVFGYKVVKPEALGVLYASVDVS